MLFYKLHILFSQHVANIDLSMHDEKYFSKIFFFTQSATGNSSFLAFSPAQSHPLTILFTTHAPSSGIPFPAGIIPGPWQLQNRPLTAAHPLWPPPLHWDFSNLTIFSGARISLLITYAPNQTNNHSLNNYDTSFLRYLIVPHLYNALITIWFNWFTIYFSRQYHHKSFQYRREYFSPWIF